MKFIITVALIFMPACLLAQVPGRVILNLTTNPSMSVAVNWRTTTLVQFPQVQYAAASDWTEFTEVVNVIDAKSEQVTLDKERIVYHHSAVIDNLNARTMYIYRVGGKGIWSEWSQFQTASNDSNDFTFVWFGDVQHGLNDYVPRIFRRAFQQAPDARFWLFTGDMVDLAQRDSQWNDLIAASGFTSSVIPWMAAAGNHEYPDTVINEVEVSYLDPSFKNHFTFPENGISGLKESSYYFDYQNVRFIVLNGNEQLSDQALWLDSILSNNPCRWTIAVLHQPLYSMGKKRDQRKTREAFLSVFDKYKVDLVLQGHDHVYSRSYKLFNGKKVSPEGHGTVYVTSMSGSDSYPLNYLYNDLMEKNGANLQLFQVISIDGRKLSFSAYTPAGTLYDDFNLYK